MLWFVLGFWASYIPVPRAELLVFLFISKSRAKYAFSPCLSFPAPISTMRVVPELLTWELALELG